MAKNKKIDLTNLTPEEELKYEIAEELGQSLGTIQAKYYKALEKLKLYFGKER